MNTTTIKINEGLAKRAKQSISFSDYKAGSATEEFNYYVNEFKNGIQEVIKRKNITITNEMQEYIDYYTSKYVNKLANAINKENEIIARCPSIMITGAGNFPVRKKEKQNAAAHKHWQETKELYEPTDNWIYRKIIAHITNAVIYSDDINAVDKIKARIKELEQQPSDPWGNNKANIRRLKGRLLELAPDEMIKDKQITINGMEATFENIIKIFDEAPIRSYDDKFYIHYPLIFKDENRTYREVLTAKISADKKYYYIFDYTTCDYTKKEMKDINKFNFVIKAINGSGNKAVIYKALKELEPKEEPAEAEAAADSNNYEGKTINGEAIEVIENKQEMRLQIIFEGKPAEETRRIMKSNGFRWSPSQGAWQRLLNDNARYALKRMTDREAKNQIEEA
jgi:hypothetical protein